MCTVVTIRFCSGIVRNALPAHSSMNFKKVSEHFCTARVVMGTVGINTCVRDVIGVSMLFVDGVSEQVCKKCFSLQGKGRLGFVFNAVFCVLEKNAG